ncbi:MAG: YbhB/YbcL family Raf kinase inhibitor-like protein [Candidatus Solibacter sp.]|nr:YbhB/YbcL family Raf kinase inhibitor-like protein [Candidatus Solibacter sp.]
MAFKAWSTAFDDGGAISRRHSKEAENVAPAIEWSDPPSGTRSYALLCEDPDAASGIFTHWLMWDIPGDCRAIPEGFEPGKLGVAGTNDFGEQGYGGPLPPAGHGPHRYIFKLYALDMKRIPLSPGGRRTEFERALWGHVIEETSVTGKYERT